MKAGDLTAWVHGNSHQRKWVGRKVGDALHTQNINKKPFYTRPLLGLLFLAACNLVSAIFIRYLLTILVQTTSQCSYLQLQELGGIIWSSAFVYWRHLRWLTWCLFTVMRFIVFSKATDRAGQKWIAITGAFVGRIGTPWCRAWIQNALGE